MTRPRIFLSAYVLSLLAIPLIWHFFATGSSSCVDYCEELFRLSIFGFSAIPQFSVLLISLIIFWRNPEFKFKRYGSYLFGFFCFGLAFSLWLANFLTKTLS